MILMQLIKQIGYFVASLIVKIARRLICQQHFWGSDQCPGQHNPLLLTAGELSGPMRGSIRKANFCKAFGRDRSCLLAG